MTLTSLDSTFKKPWETLARDAASLYWAFERVKDGRKARGKRYPLPLILTLLLLGKLAGETTINGVVDWIFERKDDLKRQLNWPKRFPVNSTYSNALACCDAQEVAQAIAQVILKARAEEQCGTEPSRLVRTAARRGETHSHGDGWKSAAWDAWSCPREAAFGASFVTV